MDTIKLFYSWQSDNKIARKTIQKAIEKTIKKLNKSDKIFEVITDSREGKGSEQISERILQSICESDLFIGDISPVTSMEAENHRVKLIPNANVMFEYGFAAGKIGIEHCKQIVGLQSDIGEKMEDMPFDVNQRSSIIFTIKDEDNEERRKEIERLENCIEKWLNERLEDIITERGKQPDSKAIVAFENGENEIELHPHFEQIKYFSSYHNRQNINPPSLPTASVLASITGVNSAIANFSNIDRITQMVRPLNISVVNKRVHDSYEPINLILINNGAKTMDDVFVKLELSTDHEVFFKESNEEKVCISLIESKGYWISNDCKKITYKCNTLNPGMVAKVVNAWLELPKECLTIPITWSISSRDSLPVSGTLIIHNQPTYDIKYMESDTKDGQSEVREIIRTE